jgi:hypothetical protein
MLSSQQISTTLANAANSQQSLYEGLFEFIKKNNTIPEFIANIKPEDPKIKTLLDAIHNADPEAKIFSDPDCYFYLLYLIKSEQIPFYQGMTVYSYLMALMQFTDKQPLRSEDQDVKFTRPLSIEKMVEDKKLTKSGQEYLLFICKRLKELEFEIDYLNLKHFILSLAPTEQWLIKLSTPLYHRGDKKPNHCDRMASVLAGNTAFIRFVTENETRTYWIPSTSLINYFLAQISPEPMQMQCSFGSTNEKTMYLIHLKGKHPVPLYAPAVKSNFRDADGWRCGPFVVWLHDMAHVFWANVLGSQDRKTILTEFIPELRKIHNKALEVKDDEAATRILKIIHRANSFDLSGSFYYQSTADRFKQYLLSVIGWPMEERNFGAWDFYRIIETGYGQDVEQTGIGQHVEDRIYFLMLKSRNCIDTSVACKQLWEMVLTCDKNNSHGDISQTRIGGITSAIAALADDVCDWRLTRYKRFFADNFKHYQSYEIKNIKELMDWKRWKKILSEFDEVTPDSEKLWKTLNEISYINDQLLFLICEYKVKFFHPYIPITESEKFFV